jgi:hypothetical protein
MMPQEGRETKVLPFQSVVALRLLHNEASSLGAASGHPGLRFEAAWPADLAARELDVYNVLFAPPTAERKGKILRFDAQEAVPAANRATFDTSLEGEGEMVWGIVAVDPETQQTWFCRLMLKAPEKASKK